MNQEVRKYQDLKEKKYKGRIMSKENGKSSQYQSSNELSNQTL